MFRPLFAASLLLAPLAADAAVHCVSSASQFRTALATAASNGEPDDIRLTRTTFTASSTARFWMHLAEPHGLRISGGWSGFTPGSCVTQTSDATRTVLDGGHSVAVLDITVIAQHVTVPVTIDTLTLRNGSTGTAAASGLALMGVADGAAVVTVDRVIVHDNVSTASNIPAVYLVSDDGFVRFSNSIVRHNGTLDAPAVWMLGNDGGVAMNHVSVLHNVRSSGGGSTEVLGIGAAQISGSLFWGNAGGDLHASDNVRYYHNRYGVGTDYALIEQLGFGNLVIADPRLQSATLPRPLADSPLRNVGSSTVGTRDVFGQPRALGGYADTGAAEYVE